MTAALDLTALHRSAGASFGRVWDRDLPLAFGGGPEAEQEAVHLAAGLIDQTYRGVLDLEGGAVDDFLERIVSSHAKALEPGRGQAACFLTAKGRVLGAFHLFRLEATAYRLVFSEPLRQEVIDGFRKYAFISDVDVKPRTDDIGVLAVQGPKAPAVLEAASWSGAPAEPLAWVTAAADGDASTAVVRAGETPGGGFELWVERRALESVWKELVASVEALGGARVGWTAADVLRIEAGLPRHGADYADDSFPGEINWEHALTYDKCYVGQEIVARMRTYGHVNRKLFHVLLADGEASEATAPGASIMQGADEAGRLTSVGRSSRLGRHLGLALVKRKFWQAGDLALEAGGRVELKELPAPGGRLLERSPES